VWGIIGRLLRLAAPGAPAFVRVAPGIAEALVTTAAGLAAAIPAVIFYNQFLQNIRDLGQRLDTFALESVRTNWKKTFNYGFRRRPDPAHLEIREDAATFKSRDFALRDQHRSRLWTWFSCASFFNDHGPILQSGIEVDVPKPAR